jgi:hypoxanthine-DNA glycosylase
VLVLGSFPGVRSLHEGRYYANPQNRFWRALSTVCDLMPDDAYESRVAALNRRGIALWDVLGACRRLGSLDQRIVRGSEEPNDIGGVVGAHPELRAILLNGRSVADLFDRLLIPRAFWPDLGVAIGTMPSTSPANAAVPPAAVERAWAEAVERFTTPRRAQH